jgi:isoleucyl-tRNA synthetase
VLWQALHDLSVAASPLLAFTAEEVWQHHPGLVAAGESVHLARFPERAEAPDAEEAWEFLLAVRDVVNRAIEPLRAAKTIATTLEADVTLTVPAAWLNRLAPYREELPGFLLVASLALEAGADGAEPVAAVRKTAFARCERCWTYRADVAREGPNAGLCERCVGAIATTGRPQAG